MVQQRLLGKIHAYKGAMSKPVRLVVFTSDPGCSAFPGVLELSQELRKHFDKLALDLFDIVMDRDRSRFYGVKKTPAMVVEGRNGALVTFYGSVEGFTLDVLLRVIISLADDRPWFPEEIRRTIRHLANDVAVRVFVESDCERCRPVSETAAGLALESSLVHAEIIVAGNYPELVAKHRIVELPTIIFGDNMYLTGHVPEAEFLEMIFRAEGVKPGPDRKCLVCGQPSPDTICLNCKSRIQAEAIKHKLASEKGGRAPSI